MQQTPNQNLTKTSQDSIPDQQIKISSSPNVDAHFD
jgi:hypothetical protein